MRSAGPGRRRGPQKPAVLLTGFGPFPGVPVNATAEIVPVIAARAEVQFRQHLIVAHILPTEWHAGLAALTALLDQHRPQLALHFGVDRTAQGFEIETRGANVCAMTADACGALPAGSHVIAGASETIPASLPVEAILARLANRGLPARSSDSAGQYLCNAVLYASLHHAAATAGAQRRTGFVHLPPDLDQGPLRRDAAIAGALEIIGVCLAAHS